MDPIESWLDAKEVRQMAERLLAPLSEEDQSTPVAVTPLPTEASEVPISSAASMEPSVKDSTKMAVGHALADARRIAEGSGMLTAKSASESSPLPAPSAEPQDQHQGQDFGGLNTGAQGLFLERLEKFSTLLRERTSASAMFLVDHDGQVMIDEVGNAQCIQMARMLVDASKVAELKNFHVKIGASKMLEMIPCRNRDGVLMLGIVCPAPIGVKAVQQVAESLQEALESNSVN